MKKVFLYSLTLFLTTTSVFALDTVFDSMDKATEVKLAPAIKTNSNTIASAAKVSEPTSTPAVNKTQSIKTAKFNSALLILMMLRLN